MVSRRRRANPIKKCLTVAVTVCCLPCICAYGIGVIAVDVFQGIKNYEKPQKRDERRKEAKARTMRRRNPVGLDMGPRLERCLTLPLRVPERVDLGSSSHDGVYWDGMIEELKSRGGKEKTIEISPPVKVLQRTEDQLESPLFKLPLEIRRQIYEEVLGGHVFHIYFVQAYRRLSHTRCKDRSTPCNGAVCRSMVKIPGAKDDWGNISLLHMLQSCRRVYSEAIEMLYKENTFDFDSLNGVLQLSRTILPNRMKLVTSVQWRYKYDAHNQIIDPSSVSYYYHSPWADCSAPEECSCVLCWPKKAGVDYQV
ncbi:hypothetical protein B7463_g1482, partial [Scytalidium lignicola]